MADKVKSTLGPEGALAALEQAREWARDEFGPPGPDHRARLAQLDGALTTAAMAISHLCDEDARHRSLHDRVTGEGAVADKHGHQDRWLEAE